MPSSPSDTPKLTHLNEAGEASMVDISDKAVTKRTAIAEGYVYLQAETLRLVLEGTASKGDVFAAARLAGIMAAKRTWDLIPLCHQLPLSKVTINFKTSSLEAERPYIHVSCLARTTGKTGVEMEALTGVSLACLTLYDMLKAADKSMTFEHIRLVEKTGGKSGTFRAVP